MGKALMAVSFIAAGAIFRGWYDLFHLFVGLPLLLVEALFLGVWRKRRQPEDMEEEIEEEKEGLGHQLFWGVLGGGLSLLLLAVGFSVASHLGLSEPFYSRDCPDFLQKIAILEEGRAYGRIVEIVEERLRDKTSAACREELTERKVRALLGWAELLKGGERIGMLQRGLQAASGAEARDLKELIAAKLRAEEKEQIIERLKRRPITLQTDVLFAPGRADLTAAAGPALKEIADFLNHDARGRKVRIEGHTDSTGSEEANQRLSQDRAEGVAGALVGYGVSREKLVVRGYGKSHPVASNDIPAGQAKNRRVEIFIQN